MSAAERLEQRLEANRRSAAASRKRTLERIEQLKQSVEEKSRRVSQLQLENEGLREDVELAIRAKMLEDSIHNKRRRLENLKCENRSLSRRLQALEGGAAEGATRG